MTTTQPTTPSTSAKVEREEELPRMSLGDHIDELRRRLIRSAIAIALAMGVVLPFKDTVTWIYVRPYEQVWYSTYNDFLDKLDAKEAELKATGEKPDKLLAEQFEFHHDYRASILGGTFPTDKYVFIGAKGGFALDRTLKALGGVEDMWVYMSATLLFAFALATPVVLYQIWAFIAAGLYQRERRMVMRSLPWALVLFLVGVLFGYFVAVPFGLYMLIQFMNPEFVQPNFSVQQYFGLLLVMTGALGLVFQLPLVMVAVHRVGLVSHAALKKYWRHFIVGTFVLAAIVTPPDVVTQLLMAVPMSILYVLGLLLTGRTERKRAKAAAAKS
ncbi:MAG: twin-arginine translocase subunit TatC [Planctomycetota bacterium]